MTLVELEKVIGKNTHDRFNVKVLLLNSYENVFELKKLFLSRDFDVVDLKDFQSNENQWFGANKLNRIINKLSNNTILFSVSEIIRFYSRDDFKNFFDNLFSIENKKINIYIPLFGLKSRFYHQYFDGFYRKNEYDFVYELDTPNDKIDLNIVSFDVPFDNTLDTIKDWLNFYNEPANNIICSPRPLVERINNQHSDDLLIINYISNQKEFIEQYMKKEFPIDFQDRELEYWNRLILDFKSQTLDQLLKTQLNLHQLSPSEILKKVCKEKELYTKWLLKGYLILENKGNGYFNEIVKHSSIHDKLIEKVWFDVFDDFDLSHANERHEILIGFYKNEKPSKLIEEKLKTHLQNCENVIPVLTGITQIEKEYIVELYALDKVNDNYIEKYYKDLTYYLEKVDFTNTIEWVDEYFEEYKQSKIKNQLSKQLSRILADKNRNKETFFEWYTDSTFKNLSDFNFNKENLFWIDGLGIEWMGVVKNYVKEKGFECEIYLSKANIPTTTQCNKFEGVQKTDALDRDYIHKQTAYRYPKNLIEEIEIIKEVLDNHLTDELVIVSDHGFSAFCSFQSKINSFNNDEHEGRCAKVDTIIEDTNYFSYDFPDCGRYLVSLNHNSLNNKTKREAHGGATPEEVIVPIVKVFKKGHVKVQKASSAKPVKAQQGFIEEDLF